ncbi:MAG: FAD-dependent oxidoreductase [Candidatus Aramenus sp.]|jgi:NADPH-dependent 2,4-dienoyl-CoA reductase/sulfur reductase-like enzyme|nr:FAD-dependent oxidoreductase [Candidatus Aramenus sp.]
MTKTDVLVIGSGVAGYSALNEVVEKGLKARVTMVSSDVDIPYDRPPLSKEYMRGQVEKPFFKPPEFYSSLKDFSLILNAEVVELRGKGAVLSNGDVIEFEKAVLATGGRPRRLNVSGSDLKGIYYLRTLRDADAIREALKGARSPVIIGGGFIGMEVASSMVYLGKRPTVIEALPHIWTTFVDEKVSEHLRTYFQGKGVDIITGDPVKELYGRESNVEEVVTQGGKRVKADMVLVAVGIVPNVEVAKRSNIAVDNGVPTDEYLRTSAKDVYAVGDVANVLDHRTEKRRRIEHWNNAWYTGALAVRNALQGDKERYDFLSTVWSDVFDLHIESGGETRDYDDSVVKGNVEENRFVVVYGKGGVTVGYVAFNWDFKELDRLNEAVKRGEPLPK